jgi:uncharacterized protein (TIGR00266 family)
MPEFNLIGSPDPFLHIALQHHEKIYCESNAMVMMERNLELKGKLQGGVLQSFLRRFANDESLFQQHIEAVHGAGDCLLSPPLDGDMQILDIGAVQYILSDGAFVAATEAVEIQVKMQGLAGALMAQTGGFFLMHSRGQGQLVVSGYGTLYEIEVNPQQEVLIDNGHVVCWDSRLSYSVSASTASSQGLVSNLVNSLTSGEGVVLRFSGQGKVVLCSRNRGNFLQWLATKFSPSR